MTFDDDTFDGDPGFKLAQKRIAEGIAAGLLDNLPGFGKPLVFEEPPPFVSREDWLTMKVLRDAGVLPPEVELMKEIAALKDELKLEHPEAVKDAKVKSLRKKELELQLLLEERSRKLRP